MIARTLPLVVVALGCGRIGFAALGGAGDASTDGGDAAVSTGPVGPRWLVPVGTTASLVVAGQNGEVVTAVEFQGTTTIGNMVVLGQSPFMSTLAARLDRTGAIVATTILDSAGFCNMRGVTVTAAGTAVYTGLAQGGAGTLGPCDTPGSGREDAIAIEVDAAGTPSLGALWPQTGGVNAQAWFPTATGDGLVVVGVYGSGLMLGTDALPAAKSNENAFVARFAGGTTPAWSAAILGAGINMPVAAAGSGTDTCLAGAYQGPTMIFGAAANNAGQDDVWVARVDATGTPRFVRLVQSTGDDLALTVLDAGDGGCIVSLAAGDLVIDNVGLPSSDGPGALLHFGASGALVSGARLPAPMQLAHVGTSLYGAFTASAPVTIGTTLYQPEGASDVLVVTLAATGPTGIVAAVAGASTQQLVEVAPIGADALVLAIANAGPISFGPFADNSTTTTGGELAVLGL